MNLGTNGPEHVCQGTMSWKMKVDLPLFNVFMCCQKCDGSFLLIGSLNFSSWRHKGCEDVDIFPFHFDEGQLYFHQSYLDDDHWGCVIVLAGFLTINYN